VPVLAVTIPSFAALLGIVHPAVGEQLQPINLVCEDNGIKMEVVAAMNDDDTAFIYLTLQDLSGKRIDESVDLFIYQVRCDGEYLSSPGGELIDYDETTGIATILITARTAGRNIDTLNGKKITVFVDSFMSDKQEFDDFDLGINLAEVSKNPKTVRHDMGEQRGMGSSSSKLMNGLLSQSTITILKPNELNIPLPGIDFVYISNIGIIDDRLHVQLRKDYGAGTNIQSSLILAADSIEAVKDNEYFITDWTDYIHIPSVNISLNIDENGEKITEPKYIENNRGTYRIWHPAEYVEFIFDASVDILVDCSLIGSYFSIYRNYVECDLEATFEIAAITDSKTVECDIDLDGIKLSSVTVSPFGVVISGVEEETYTVNLKISVTMTDGSIEHLSEQLITNKLNGSSTSYLMNNPNVYTSAVYGENGEISLKFMLKIPFDIDRIASVTINGETVNIK
jgi:hypothetical protein